MSSNFLSVKQDNGDVMAITTEEFCVLRNIHFLKLKNELSLTADENLLGSLTEIAIGHGVDGDGRRF